MLQLNDSIARDQQLSQLRAVWAGATDNGKSRETGAQWADPVEGAVPEGAAVEGAVADGAVPEGATDEAAMAEGATDEVAVAEGLQGGVTETTRRFTMLLLFLMNYLSFV